MPSNNKLTDDEIKWISTNPLFFKEFFKEILEEKFVVELPIPKTE